ncbi:50S ribosomal protein L6 [Patescibacteria group bacterium]|nr:50S ribosomal protein L6 [Patescibacteria group bacterium]
MSRIGKQPIVIPEKTEVAVSNGSISVKGPLGELSRPMNSNIAVEVKDKKVVVSPLNDTIEARALWGTYASHISNMIRGVNEAFGKKLVVEGIGFKTELEGNVLVLSVGFSHKVRFPIPDGLSVSVEKNTISIQGSNKELVGQFAAEVRSSKKPEPYKGKGIHYEDEVVKRKQGKRAVT